MSFQETVLIEFLGSDKVSPTVASLNKALESLGKNNAFKKLSTNMNLYIKDVDLWKKKLNDLQKTSPTLKANTNFQQVIQDVEKLQKGFQLALKDAEALETRINKGIKTDTAKKSLTEDLRKTFNNSKELENLFNSTQQKLAPKGVLASDKDIVKSTTGAEDLVKDVDTSKQIKFIADLDEPQQKESKKSKKPKSEESDAKTSQTVSELSKTFKSFNSLLKTVTTSLEKFNQALKGATDTGKNSKNKGSGNGGNGGNNGGKSSGGSRDGVPSDRFMETQSHKFDDYKNGIGSNAYNEYIQSQRANRIGKDDGRTPASLSGEALNKAAEYNRITNSLVSGSHGVVSAVNEMARANENYTTNVKNATKETDFSGNAQLTVQQKVANAVKQVTDLQNSNGVTPSNVTGGMFNAISSHSRSYEDMKGSMADLHSGKDTLQLGEEAIAKRKASQSVDAQTRKIALQSNIPDIDIQLKKLKENLVNASASPHKITLESNIPNVDAQLNKLRKDFNIPTTNALVPVNNQLGQVHNTVRNLKADSKSIPINVETQSASRNVMQIADNFNMLGQSLNMATGALTQFLSIVGSGNMVGDMLQYASLRQTNEVMLTARRGRAEAEKMYDSIQQLVIRLPGNDTFMTQILTMLGTMDKSLTTGDLNEIGNTISDYYMAAKAKGQFNNETERELRNYLMTGETRNLTNSVLASEIESLKDLDNIMDRTNALQKAMQKTGLDSIAHYNTYANKLEEFTGRFQKAFADLGDYLIMVVQPMMELFSLIDDITNSGASQAVLMLIGSILGVVSMVSIAGMGVQILTYSVMGLASGLFILDDVKKKGIVTAILQNRQLDEESRARLRNTSIVQNGVRATITNTLVRIKEGAANIYVAMSSHILGNEKVREEAISKSLILTKLQSIYTSFSEILANTWEYLSLFRLRDGQIQYNMAKGAGIALKVREIRATITNTLNKIWEATVTFLTVDAENLDIIARVKNIAVKVAETAATLGLNIAMWGLIGASIVLDIVMSPITLTILAIVGAILLLIKGIEWLGQSFGWWNDIGGMFEAIQSGIGRVWDAFMNSEPVQQIITTFQNFAYTIETLFNFIGSIGGGLWELIFGVDNGESGGAFDIVGLLLEVVGAVGNFLYQISPLKLIVDIFNAIGSAIAWVLETWNDFVDSAEMQGLIKAFQDARLIIGEAFGEISEAFGEVWDALAPIGEALGSIFDDGSTEEATNDTNILLDVLKAFASVITTIVVPAVQVLVFPLRVVAEVIRTIADAISWVIGLFSNPGEYIGNLTNMIVNEFANIPRRLIGMFLGLPGQLFGGLVDGVLNILGIHSPGYIQEAVVGEFLGIPSRILGGIGNIVGAVGNFASAIWNGFDSIFGTDISGTIDGFINRLSSSFNKLKEGDIIGAVKDFGDNFLNTLDGIFGADISGMVGGFFNQINDNWNKLSQGDFLGALKGTTDWYNDSIKRFTGVDLNQMISATPLGRVMGLDNSNGLMQNPQNLVTGQALTQNYNNATTHSPTIVNNNFGEGSVQADARNMSAKDVQKMFTGAFGYNKARGTQGIIK